MKRITLILFGFLLINMFGSVSALSLGVHVPEKYTDVIAGERFYFEIDIKYPENPSRKDLRLEYEILTRDGESVSQSKALKAVETQASFIDFIVIPKSAKSGLHIINVKIKDYETLSEEVSSSFHVKTSNNEVTFYLVIIFAAIIFVGILVILGIILRKK